MRRAFELARNAEGMTAPNPMVGAVIVNDGEIVGEGFHSRAGAAHAEVEAIRNAGSLSLNSTLYVNLEPCNHHGRTPPCTEAIITAGIQRVVYSVPDPNPDVIGGGTSRLRRTGIEVVGGVLAHEGRYLNRFFLHHNETRRPWVVLKFASSLDGRTATSTGESKWITGAEARARSHELRATVDAVVVGAGTVIADNPELTVRYVDPQRKNHPAKESPKGEARQPIRVVLDSRGRVPIDSKVYNPDLPGKTITVGTEAFCPVRADQLRKRNVELITVPTAERGRVYLDAMVISLGRREVQSVMVEGGSNVHGSFLSAGLVDEVWAFIAPSVIGGEASPAAVGGRGIPNLGDRLHIVRTEVEQLGSDFLIRGIRSGFLND